jgi:hypothetical protein
MNKKSLVSRPAFGFIIFSTPQFRNPYLTKRTNQLGTALLVTLANRDIFLIFLEFPSDLTVSICHRHFKCLNLDFC